MIASRRRREGTGGEESVAAAEGRNAREESVAAGGVRGGWANAAGLGFHAAPG
jgi:hypothetical protein